MIKDHDGPVLQLLEGGVHSWGVKRWPALWLSRKGDKVSDLTCVPSVGAFADNCFQYCLQEVVLQESGDGDGNLPGMVICVASSVRCAGQPES